MEYNKIKISKNSSDFMRINKLQKYILIFCLLILNLNLLQAQSIQADKKIQSNNNIKKIASIGDVTVSRWADGKKSAFSFTFDDGYMSQYTYAWPILKQYGFRATFYLIADALTDNAPAIYKYGYWWQFADLAAAGNEIGDHTMTHPDLSTLPIGDANTPHTITYELVHSKEIIEQKLPGVKLLTIAYPFGSYNSQVISVASQYYKAARGIGGYISSSSIYGNDWYSLIAGNIIFSQTRSTVDDQEKLNSYLDLLQNQTIANGKWSIFLAHEVVPADSIYAGKVTDYYPVATDWLNSLCQWLKQKSDSNEVWVATVANVMKYVKERESFSYSLISSGNSEIEFNPNVALNDTIYNYPLTVNIVVPPGWSNVLVQQGGNTYYSTAYSYNGINYVQANVVPNGGSVTLTIQTGGYTVSGNVSYNNSIDTPLSNVIVTLKNQSDSLVTSTDINGKFSFNNINSGNYTITASKQGDWKDVNSTDALLAAKYYARLTNLSSLQLKAADVNDNGKVNSTDALMIAKRYVNLINSFTKPDWVFSTPIDVSVTNQDIVVNFKGMVTGDINESYK